MWRVATAGNHLTGGKGGKRDESQTTFGFGFAPDWLKVQQVNCDWSERFARVSRSENAKPEAKKIHFTKTDMVVFGSHRKKHPEMLVLSFYFLEAVLFCVTKVCLVFL